VIDLEEIRRCNERLKELISDEIDESKLMRILAKRAEKISSRREEDLERAVLSDAIVSRRGDMMLGFPIEFVKEVRKNYSVPLAHGNEIVIGLFQSRGQISSVVDVLPLVGQPTSGHPASNSPFIIHLSREGRDIGVVVDEIVGRRVFYQDESAGGHAHDGNALVVSVTKDLVSVIDTQALFSSPSIILGQSGR
jgi:chemotaxis signal transduction protein